MIDETHFISLAAKKTHSKQIVKNNTFWDMIFHFLEISLYYHFCGKIIIILWLMWNYFSDRGKIILICFGLKGLKVPSWKSTVLAWVTLTAKSMLSSSTQKRCTNNYIAECYAFQNTTKNEMTPMWAHGKELRRPFTDNSKVAIVI